MSSPEFDIFTDNYYSVINNHNSKRLEAMKRLEKTENTNIFMD